MYRIKCELFHTMLYIEYQAPSSVNCELKTEKLRESDFIESFRRWKWRRTFRILHFSYDNLHVNVLNIGYVQNRCLVWLWIHYATVFWFHRWNVLFTLNIVNRIITTTNRKRETKVKWTENLLVFVAVAIMAFTILFSHSQFTVRNWNSIVNINNNNRTTQSLVHTLQMDLLNSLQCIRIRVNWLATGHWTGLTQLMKSKKKLKL